MQTTRRRWRDCVSALCVVAIVYAAGGQSAAQAGGCPDSKLADKAGKAMIAAAQAGSPDGFTKALTTYADMREIAIFALGKHRKRLPDGRLGELTKATTGFVSRKLDGYRLKFRAQEQTMLDCRGDKIVGKLNFLGGKPPQQIIWRIKNGRVQDVNVQNVWLSQLLRKHFDGVMNKANGDIDVLFAALKK